MMVGNRINNKLMQIKLKIYLSTNHVKHNYIAQETGLSNCTISLFLKGKREIAQDKLKMIDDIINQ